MRVRAIQSKGSERRRGVSLLMVSFAVVGLSVLALALFTTVSSTGKAQKGSRDIVNASLVAEAGLAEAMLQLSRGEDATLGNEQQPLSLGSGSYWVTDADLGSGDHMLTSFGVENGVGSRIELVVQQVTNSDFTWAAFGDESLEMSSNAHVDSYDSSLGSYDSQQVNGSGSDAYALSNGHIGSNGSIAMSQNSAVEGSAIAGPAGSATILGNATVSGSTAPATSLVEMPPIEVPSIPSVGDLTISNNSTATIPSGDHHIGALVLKSNARINVTGPARVVLDSFDLGSGSEFIVDASNGGVEIFVLDDFVMNSNTLIASDTYTPADIEINLLSDNVIDPSLDVDLDEVDFDSNAQLYGTIYAPSAAIEINSNFELFGSLVARSVVLDSWSRIHFDEALLTSSSDEEIQFQTVAWRKLPYHP